MITRSARPWFHSSARVVQPSLEQRRGRAVVLGRAEHDDRVGVVDVGGAVVVRGPPHGDRGAAHQQERHQPHQGDRGPDRVPAEPAHPTMLRGRRLGPRPRRGLSRCRAPWTGPTNRGSSGSCAAKHADLGARALLDREDIAVGGQARGKPLETPHGRDHHRALERIAERREHRGAVRRQFVRSPRRHRAPPPRPARPRATDGAGGPVAATVEADRDAHDTATSRSADAVSSRDRPRARAHGTAIHVWAANAGNAARKRVELRGPVGRRRQPHRPRPSGPAARCPSARRRARCRPASHRRRRGDTCCATTPGGRLGGEVARPAAPTRSGPPVRSTAACRRAARAARDRSGQGSTTSNGSTADGAAPDGLFPGRSSRGGSTTRALARSGTFHSRAPSPSKPAR